jgi:hypothetical protein
MSIRESVDRSVEREAYQAPQNDHHHDSPREIEFRLDSATVGCTSAVLASKRLSLLRIGAEKRSADRGRSQWLIELTSDKTARFSTPRAL